MGKHKEIYRGKAKTLYENPEQPDILIQRFEDSITAGNGAKHDILKGKGAINKKISSILFEYLENNGIKTHFIKCLSDTDMAVVKLDIVPIEFVVRNVAAGSISRRLGLSPGLKFEKPIVEYYLKSDDLGDPMLSEEHIIKLGLLNGDTLKELSLLSLKINELLFALFDSIGIILVDIKFEFGFNSNREILLGDEISPDTTRLWDKNDRRIFDKDIYRKDLGDVLAGYTEVLNRLQEYKETANE